MLKIIDLKIGNIGSLVKAINYLGVAYQVVDEPLGLEGASKIILPGVGNFKAASQALFATGFYDALRTKVLIEHIPILGICVGMQLFASVGDEGGGSKGLGFFDAEVKKINNFDGTLITPHMGWNDVHANQLEMFFGIEEDSCFYFVHSYSMRINENVNVAMTSYGENIVAYVNKGHIHGTQFHPEKSQQVGLQFLRNFIKLC
jgi:glutamine amidotransferase